PEPLRSQLLLGKMNAGVEDHEYQVIPTAWVMAAQARWQQMSEPDGPYTATGVDVARGGKDATVLAPRKWNWFASLEAHPGQSTPDGPAVAALVLAALGKGGYANIDVIGVGSSAYDHARLYTDKVHPINFASEPWGTDRAGVLKFVNLRAYAYWSFREMLDPDNGDSVVLPPDPELRADLCAPRWMIRASGIQVESKDDIAKRIGRSTDKGDAVVLSALPQQVVTYGQDIWS
ncbi:MAG: terminase, partial [Chloroflexota bacterium]|nr:terminase [Chloroflexota bacterium]